MSIQASDEPDTTATPKIEAEFDSINSGALQLAQSEVGVRREGGAKSGLIEESLIAPETELISTAETEPAVVVKDGVFRTRAWADAQPASFYSAQILGSYSKETALKFIDRVGVVEQEVFYLKTMHKGQPWYVVFYGTYSNKSTAKAAVAVANKSIQSQNPWLRRFEGIQKSYPEK